jgi:hemerythrin-like domain-containing protein
MTARPDATLEPHEPPAAPQPAPVSQGFADEALETFSRSHVHIVDTMNRLRVLPMQLAQRGLDDGVRASAVAIHRFFNDSVLEHHDEEERELFPSLAHSAGRGDEAALVGSLIARLAREHREIESLWDRIEPGLRRLARGRSAPLDERAIEQIVALYVAHAAFEESTVLPLAARILKSGDRAALALGLAMRRTPYRINAYI